MKLTMNRRGNFRCNWSSADNKCGTGTELTPAYAYHCHIETADILDQHGFIIDQLEIDKYFQTKYYGNQPAWKTTPAQSCEKIALNAVNDIKRMIENHMLSNHGMSVIYRIAVTISLSDQSSPAQMTAEWLPEATKPIANVKRRRQKGTVSIDIETAPVSKPKHGLQPYGCGCVLFRDPEVGKLYKHGKIP